MGAVDVGVGHDDDALVAQPLVVEVRAGAAAQRLDEVLQLLVLAQLVGRGAGDVQDLAAQGQDRLGLAVARLLGRAAGRIALDQEDLGAVDGVLRAVGELAGQAQLAGRRSCAAARCPACAAAAPRRAGDDELEQGTWPASLSPVSQWSKLSPTMVSTSAGASTLTSFSLVWPWNCGSRMNTETRPAAPSITSSAVIMRAPCGCRSVRRRRFRPRGQRAAEGRPRACRLRASARCCSRTA